MTDILETLHTETKGAAKKKRDKVRSAWISFAGRIAAQLVGAIATVMLGLLVLHRYSGGGDNHSAAKPAELAVTVIVVSPEASLPTGENADESLSTESRERQMQMARAIGKAVAGAMSSSH